MDVILSDAVARSATDTTDEKNNNKATKRRKQREEAGVWRRTAGHHDVRGEDRVVFVEIAGATLFGDDKHVGKEKNKTILTLFGLVVDAANRSFLDEFAMRGDDDEFWRLVAELLLDAKQIRTTIGRPLCLVDLVVDLFDLLAGQRQNLKLWMIFRRVFQHHLFDRPCCQSRL